MARELDLAYITLAAELLERALDAQFDIDFDESGLFKKRKVNGRTYWYYKPSQKGTDPRPEKYVGPADDPEIAKRVSAFASIKDDYQRRRKLVSTLRREARLFGPNTRIGDLIEALWKAGVFRLRACLVGTVAYQAYGTVLGYRLADTAMQTGDIDIAQFKSISIAVEDSIPPVLNVLQAVDEKFKPLPGLNDEEGTTRFAGRDGLRVEFLTPNQGSDDQTRHPIPLPALGGAAGEPLRFLDYLIYEPVRTVMLHKGGIPVLVPQPQRYSVHKMIVATRRPAGASKEVKDLRQANSIAMALLETRRPNDLVEAFEEAAKRGPHWKGALETARERMISLGLTGVEKCLNTK
ncbi:MAG: GSU2403 family nucleotidyltransferase fold protein [Parvibaculaceae bacterium]